MTDNLIDSIPSPVPDSIVGVVTYNETRRERLMASTATPGSKDFDPRIPFEIALGLSKPQEIFTAFGVSPEDALLIAANPVFQTRLRECVKDVRENGATFKAKAKSIAEELLKDAYQIAKDPEQSGAVRADLIKWSAKMAGYEPAPAKDGAVNAGAFSLSIVLNQPAVGTREVVIPNVTMDVITVEGERLET